MGKFIAGLVVGFLVTFVLGFRTTVYHRFPELDLDGIEDIEEEDEFSGGVHDVFIVSGTLVNHDDSGLLPGHNHN